ncbi:hypothetical protein ES332_A10G166600v1 [Gossypium tomentosum]|uniref:Uncharacterized protein n=1 Tax=Gossypium tomentosum TaxID=34277 RepID=A0A5D2NQV7_GOSTO|nr:hypothetical protein ES332_A10G166600v1 [Gossypium tomentosum]
MLSGRWCANSGQILSTEATTMEIWYGGQLAWWYVALDVGRTDVTRGGRTVLRAGAWLRRKRQKP